MRITKDQIKESIRWEVKDGVLTIYSLPIKLNTMEEQKCRECGCTDNDCSQCIKKQGEPCYWIEDDLCSACAYAEKKWI